MYIAVEKSATATDLQVKSSVHPNVTRGRINGGNDPGLH